MSEEDRYVSSKEFVKHSIRKLENAYYCEVCSCSIPPSKTMVYSHITGSRHVNAIRRKDEEQKLSETLLSKSGRNRYPGIRETSKGFYCKLCDSMCTSTTNVETHIKGSKHIAELRYLESGSRRHRHSSRSTSSPRSSTPRMNNKDGERPEPIHLEKILKPSDLVIGLDFVVEYYVEPTDPKDKPKWFYSCTLCKYKCRESDIVDHITGLEHHLAIIKDYKKEDYVKLKEDNSSQNKLAYKVEEWVKKHYKEHGRGTPSCKPMPSLTDQPRCKRKQSEEPDIIEVISVPKKPKMLVKEVIELDSDNETPAALSSSSTPAAKLLEDFECKNEQDSKLLSYIGVSMLAAVYEYELKEANTPLDKVQEIVEAYKNTCNDYIVQYLKKFSMAPKVTSTGA